MSTAYVESARPYPGLRPFEPHEADIFFGREEHTDRLLEILRAQRFLAVIGPSGSGKSSLVRAGLLPALAMGGLGSGSVWRVAVLRPGDRPIERLAAALLQALSAEYGAATDDVPGAAADASADPVDVATLAAELRRGPLGLLHAVEAAWQRGDGASNLLVLVDQFEELFTYAEAAGPGRDESEAFVRLLLAARRSPAARIHVAMTMRTDFLGHCVRWLELPDEINRAQYLTPRLDRQQMERAILAPAQVFGGAIEASLVAELINATGHNSDQLPLVQHALSRMWPLAQSRTPGAPHIGWDDARAIGGVEGAPDQHAETLLAATLATLPPTRTNLPEALFRLITARRAGGQDVRAPRTLARITAACGLEPAQWLLVAEVVRPWAAADASLLQHGARLDPDSVIDLSHEALIRQWKRLGDWVADEARRAAEYRRWVERAADEDRPDGVPLTGADLARALDWLNPEPAQSLRPWQPSAAWAARYAAHTEDEGASAVEYERTVRYILSSRQARERAAAEAAQRALEASQIASERAHAQETTRLLRRARIALIAAAVAGVAVLGAVSWALLQTREAASAQEEAARLERLRAGDEQAREARSRAAGPGRECRRRSRACAGRAVERRANAGREAAPAGAACRGARLARRTRGRSQ